MIWTTHTFLLTKAFPFLSGWIGDKLFGDPENWWHPVITFGKLISSGERKLNHGEQRFLKGTVLACVLIAGTYLLFFFVLKKLQSYPSVVIYIFTTLGVFYCLAGTTLLTEVKGVFDAVKISLDKGRKQVARIVGRDTSTLSEQDIRTAALETLSENLSDGVIAPMFWFVFLGLPGMMAYKMVNTLDSMIGYKNERYNEFGKAAAKIDDVANYIPARLTALGMVLVSMKWSKIAFVLKYGKAHASPNSGYPEAALAGILDCRFGGTHDYFGQAVEKPYIGGNDRLLTDDDLITSSKVCSRTEILMGIIVTIVLYYSS